MYLSRVEINPYRRDTMRAMQSPEIMHAAVMASFDSFDTAEERVLWRIDRVGPATYLLVQSRRKPDFSHIVDQFGRPASVQAWDTVEYDGFLSRIEDGQTLRFRLRANPTRSVSSLGTNGRGKVVAHVTAEQQIAWFRDRSDSIGVEVVEVDVVQRDSFRFKHGKRPITLSVATFEGTLKVKDATELRRSMESGIGRAKAYGCGLLTVMRV